MMRKINKKGISIFILSVFLFNALFSTSILTVNAISEVLTASKDINKSAVIHGEEINVTVNVKGTPPVNTVIPNDIILIIDKSGSMSGQKIQDARESAKAFVDLMDMTKHRVGIVDFSLTQNIGSLPLTNDPSEVKNYINGIKPGGGTHTGSAIRKATEMLQNHRKDAQPVIIIMTDGAANYGGSEEAGFKDAKEAATYSKEAGIIFYTIALLDQGDNPSNSPQNKVLKEMATTSQHHHFVLGSVGLNDIYKAIVKEIGIVSAYDLTIKDVVSPEFEIVPGSYDANIPKPTVNGNEISWHLLELKDQKLTFNYKIRVKDSTSVGKYPVASESTVNYTDFTGVKNTVDLNVPIISVEYPAPTITTVTPDNGDMVGGNEIIIKGTNFRPDAKVYFDSTLATKVTYVNENEISVIVPEGRQKTVTLKVVNVDGKFAKSSYLYWTTPVVTSITPNEGPVTGNTSLIIVGNYFMNGIKVKIGDKEAKSVMYVSSTLIYATTDEAENVGMVDVTLTNPDGREVKIDNGFNYIPVPEKPAPEITSINPNSMIYNEKNKTISIHGKNFQEGAKVRFGDKESLNVKLKDETYLRVTVPSSDEVKIVDVTVINPDGKEIKLVDGFNYLPVPELAPEIRYLNPNSIIYNEENKRISIHGHNFKEGAKVRFGDKEGLSITVGSESYIDVTVPTVDNPSVVDITVINPDGKEVKLVNGFNYLPVLEKPAPEITYLNENSMIYDEKNKAISVYGYNFQKGAKVKFGDKEGLNISVNSATYIRVTVPTVDNPSVVDITVINPDGKEVKLDKGFNYLPEPEKPSPEITHLSSNSIIYNEKNKATKIYGYNFQKGAKVKFGDKEGLDVTVMSATYIRVMIPNVDNPNVVDITVINPDGKEVKLVDGFNYLPVPETLAPEIASLNENSMIYNEENKAISIFGQSFQKGAKVKFGDKEGLNISVNSETYIRVTVPIVDKAKLVDVTVINPDGKEVKLVDGFNYLPVPETLAPEIASLNENSMIYNEKNKAISIYGHNFQKGAKVKFGDKEGLNISVNSATYIRVTVPTVDNPSVVDVTVINPDGKEVKLVDGFNYLPEPEKPAPEITHLSSNSIIYNEKNKATNIYGYNFQKGAKVKFGDNELLNVTVMSATYIRVMIPTVDNPMVVDVTVINPDGKEVKLINGFNYIALP